MNFFEAQEVARRNSILLIILYVLAVGSLIVLLNMLVMSIYHIKKVGHIPVSWEQLFSVYNLVSFLVSALGVVLFIVLASLYKMSVLSRGGSVVAEMLGGRVIAPNSSDPKDRKILNVVEEMAIASGMPVPSVYLLDEESINAFAAGWSPSTATIGITRGAVMHLTRDELQGVIAHEFSHVFNGDMRLNIRLVGLLHGILVVGITGKYMLRAAMELNTKHLTSILMLFGMVLAVFGYCGTFFGNCIKAIACRQREYLADASAVQYTRQTLGIAGALKKIGGLRSGSKLSSPLASEFSHAYFSSGVYRFLLSTHPPLEKRIRRIEPHWNGEFLMPENELSDLPDTGKDKKRTNQELEGAQMLASTALHAINHIGRPGQQEIDYAQALYDEIPAVLQEEARDPFSARALIYSSLIHHRAYEQQLQWNELQKNADSTIYARSRKLFPVIESLPARLRLPVYQLSIPALRTLSDSQYAEFRRNVDALIQVDWKVSFSEWVVQRFIIQQLDEAYGFRKPTRAIHWTIDRVKPELALVLSVLAYIEHDDDTEAHHAFQVAVRGTGITKLQPVRRDEIEIAKLDKALDKLEEIKPLVKSRILKAMISCLMVDDKISVAGYELTRTLSSCFGCPMPPIMLPMSEK